MPALPNPNASRHAGDVAAGAASLALAAPDGAELTDAELAAAEPGAVELEVTELDLAQPGAGGDDDAGLDATDPAVASTADGLPDDELPESGRPSHLRVAPEIERGLLHRRRRAQLLVLGVAAISAASMFLLVTFHVFAAQSAFTLDKLDNQLSVQQRDYGLLRDKVATLSSPDAVANGAKRLGMIRATEVTGLHPPAAASFASTNSLPVPPLTPYRAIDDTGQ